ncbi:hypothetical protein EIP91_010172 [Steccherinum ochraceum]|uniref:Uncharacterized protein n=1 Tax=Steccherinum ochraceum TaxID=92696 RepID=A0A4R0RU17_9APHY|nr:hypothetical protein EIP91_010172 [Steccherinum ochraceum]
MKGDTVKQADDSDPVVALFGRLTGYRLLVVGSVLGYAFYRFTVLCFGLSLMSFFAEMSGATLLGFGLYLLSTRVYASRAGFLFSDYTDTARPFLRSYAIFIFGFAFYMSMVFMVLGVGSYFETVLKLSLKYIDPGSLGGAIGISTAVTGVVGAVYLLAKVYFNTPAIRVKVNNVFSLAFTSRHPSGFIHYVLYLLSAIGGVVFAGAWLIRGIMPWWTGTAAISH